MKYSKVYIDSIGYEIAPVVVSSAELEVRLEDLYRALHLAEGQLEALTGIVERRWWEDGYRLSDGAFAAARRRSKHRSWPPKRSKSSSTAGSVANTFEPATACRVAALLGVGPETAIHDVSNACLGVLTGMVDVANRIELGQIRAGMVVSCETAREINEIVIDQMLDNKSMDFFKRSLATLTGGSGAVAVLLSDGSLSASRSRRLLGGANRAAPQYHELCRWGIERLRRPSRVASISSRRPTRRPCSPTASSWASRPGATSRDVSVGSTARSTRSSATKWAPRIERRCSKSLGIPESKDFSTYRVPGQHGHRLAPDDGRSGRGSGFPRNPATGWRSWGSAADLIA